MKENSRLLGCLLLVVGCSQASAARPTGFQGVLEFEERTAAFEVAGRVRTVAVHRGDALADGAEVATLDDSLVRPMREARQAEIDAARARISLLRAGARPSEIRTLEAQIAGARTHETMLQRNAARTRGLATNGALPTSQADDLEAQRDRARAERESLEERLRTTRSGARPQEVSAAQAQLHAAEQALAIEDQRLARHALHSRGAGTVLDVLVDPGDVVAPGTPVATVADTAHPYVDVFVPQGRIGSVRLGQRASVRVDATREDFAARVEDVGRQTEFTPRYIFSEGERAGLMIRVRVRVDDPAGRLHAGVPAAVTLEGTRP